jgi:hypothetical protein
MGIANLFRHDDKYREFGNWKEFGKPHSDTKQPIYSYINTDTKILSDREKIVKYLDTSTYLYLGLSSGLERPNFFTGQKNKKGSMAFYTDGDLREYILVHNVCIPEVWHKKMKRLHFIPFPVKVEKGITPLFVHIIRSIVWLFKWLVALVK